MSILQVQTLDINRINVATLQVSNVQVSTDGTTRIDQPAANTFRIVINSANVAHLNEQGITITGDIRATGNISANTGWQYFETLLANSSGAITTSNISGYKSIRMTMESLFPDLSSSNGFATIQLSSDGGATWANASMASNWHYQYANVNSVFTDYGYGSRGEASLGNTICYWGLSNNTSFLQGLSGTIEINGLRNSSNAIVRGDYLYASPLGNNFYYYNERSFAITNTAAPTHIRIKTRNGINITAGRIVIETCR